MINKMDLVKNHGLMVQIMKVYMKMVKNMEKDYLFGMMEADMKENF